MLASGDLDEDGNVDIVTGGTITTAFFGNGDGTFAEGAGLLGFSYNLALGDVNGDGHLNLVTLEGGSHIVTCRLGSGDGTFGAPVSELPVSSNLANLVLGDVDGDGVLDVVTSDSSANLWLLKGGGDGSFTPVISVSGNRPLALGDVNGDGYLDVATMNRNIAQVAVYLGNAFGSLGVPTLYDLPTIPWALAITDLDEDGHPEIVVAAGGNVPSVHGSVYVLRNNGDGSFSAATALDVPATVEYVSLEVDDLNGDGHLDLMAGVSTFNEVLVKLGNGDGTFGASATYGAVIDPSALSAEDFDGDGDLDLAVKGGSSSSRNFEVLFGNGDGTFPVHPDYPLDQQTARSIDLADVDGDGDLDVGVAYSGITATDQGYVSVLLGNDDGSFAAPLTYPAGLRSSFVRFRDLNGDGTLDLVVANEGSGLSVLLGAGGGMFGPATQYGTGLFPAGFDVGDVDGNGTLDVVVAHRGGGLTVLPGNGDGTFGSGASLFSSTDFSSVALGDVDGDGVLDIAAKYSSYAFVAVSLGSGDGSFAPMSQLATGNRDGDVLFADVDGDGDLDLATGSRNSGIGDGKNFVSILLGNGDGSFAPHVDYLMGERPGSIAIGRVDDDAFVDIVSAHPDQDTVSVLLGLGDGTFSNRTTYDVGHRPNSVALGDLNGDGKLDFVTVNESTPSTSALLPGTISPRLQEGGSGGAGSGPPETNAGPDRTVEAGSVVTLDGSASTSPSGGALELEWIQTAGPEVFLSGARSATPSFVPSVLGEYGFQLTATSDGASSTDDVLVTVVGRPDLALTVVDGRTAVVPGQSFTRTLTVTNEGNAPATGVRLADELPLHTVFESASDGGSAIGHTVAWPELSLAPAETAVRSVTLTVASSFPSGIAELTHTASVADDGALGADPTPDNNVSVDTNELVAAPDLAVGIDDGKARAVPGESSTYVVTVGNSGSQEATGALLRVAVPPHASLVSASDGGVLVDGSLAWPAFPIAAGATVVRTFTVRLDDAWPYGSGEVRASATVGDDGANGPDSRIDDNFTSDVDAILLPDLAVSMDDGVDVAVPGTSTTYRVQITNRGHDTASGIAVTDTLPPGAAFESASDGGLVSGGDVLWPPFDLAPGASALRTVTIHVDDPLDTVIESLTNTVAVRDDGAHGPDPTPENDVARDTNRVSRPPTSPSPKRSRRNPAFVDEELDLHVRDCESRRRDRDGSHRRRFCCPFGQRSFARRRVRAPAGPSRFSALWEILPRREGDHHSRRHPDQTGTLSNDATATSTTADPGGANNHTSLATQVDERAPSWTFTDAAAHADLRDSGGEERRTRLVRLQPGRIPGHPRQRGRRDERGRPELLYFNDGDRTFTEVTATHAAGLSRRRASRTAICGDLNGDGYADLARNDQGVVEIYLNRGPLASPPFSFGDDHQSPSQTFTSLEGGMSAEGMGLLDFDRDGDLDLVLDNSAFGIDLLMNDGAGRFVHGTPDADTRGLPATAGSGDFLAVGDYDVDGFVDVLGRERDQIDLWHNRGDGTFEPGEGLDEQADEANKGGVAFCDFDADGDFDAVWTDAGVSQNLAQPGWGVRADGRAVDLLRSRPERSGPRWRRLRRRRFGR